MLTRVIATLVLMVCIALFSIELLASCDLYDFEYGPIIQLLGLSGLAVILVINAGFGFLAYLAIRTIRFGWRAPRSRGSILALATSALLTLWVLDTALLETPLSIRAIQLFVPDDVSISFPESDADFASFSLTNQTKDTEARQRLRTMYERVRVNAPEVYSRNPIGATIDRNSRRYGTDPLFLFFRAYINSYYGEATSGPVPYLRSMTAETARDLVQAHLPGWFIESGWRKYLISSQAFPALAGEQLGFKLRYAMHKATLDVSTQPYDLSTYSDVFLVMKEYPQEFQDIFEAKKHDTLRAALRESFTAIRDTAMLRPYEQPYGHAAFDEAYYDSSRQDLKRFARAAFYLLVLDFDFATRVQCLLATYQNDYYKTKFGHARLAAMPRWQQIALLAMTRDVFTPNVGRMAYNLYALPELHWPGVEYIAEGVRLDTSTIVGPTQTTLWRPANPAYLWAAPGYQLVILNEVWSLVETHPIPGLTVGKSADDALSVVWRAAH